MFGGRGTVVFTSRGRMLMIVSGRSSPYGLRGVQLVSQSTDKERQFDVETAPTRGRFGRGEG